MLLKDRYLVEKELGRGGIGLVYLARDQQLHSRPVVIKVLLDETDDQSDRDWFRKKFLQEIEALSRIDHPGIVGILDTGEMDDGQPFLVMQFIPGQSLRAVMKDGQVEFGRAASLVWQIGRALTVAHEHGVIHRDLKPENIMLAALDGGEEMVKLIDFGIATVRDAQAATGREKTAVAGTVAYMAPEQLQGRPSSRSDTFALGVIAYELLTGRRPFNPRSPYELLEMQRLGVQVRPRELRADLSAAAERVILKALEFDQTQRYERARDFGEALFQTLTTSEKVDSSGPDSRRSGTDGLITRLITELLTLSTSNVRALGLQLWVEAQTEIQGERRVRDFTPDAPPPLPRYRLGERVAICARAEGDCFIWVMAVGASGRNTILYPRGRASVVEKGQTVRVPGTLTGQPGLETVLAFASTSPELQGVELTTPEALVQRAEDMLKGSGGGVSDFVAVRFQVVG